MTKDTSKGQTVAIEQYIGIDLGDSYSQVCVLDCEGDVLARTELRTDSVIFEKWFKGMPHSRIVIEVGSSSRFIEAVLSGLGHEVLVANSHKLALIYGAVDKCDEKDAEKLARLGRVDPKLLSPVQHRSEPAQKGLRLVKARDRAVRCRTSLINMMRGMCKADGHKLPNCDADYFHTKIAKALPDSLKAELGPTLELIEKTTETILYYDKELSKRADELAPGARKLATIPGVGLLTAVSFFLTVDDPKRFASSRQVGAYFGLVPKRDQSGKQDKALPITKRGDKYVRRLLVQCAQHVLRENSPDSELKRWGLVIAAKSKNAKKRAVIAVARKLAVLMHRLWVTGQAYDPNFEENKAQGKAA